MAEHYTHVMQVGNSLLYRGVKDGKKVKKKFTYKPTLFLPSQNQNAEWHTLSGEPLDPKTFASIYEAKAFARKYDDIENLKIYGNQRYVYTFIGENHPGLIEHRPEDVVVGIIDIEVESRTGFPDVERASDPVTAINLLVNGHYHVFGTKPYDNQRKDVTYYRCEDEGELLTKFLEIWQAVDLDIITGWNVKLFDIPYLCNRIISMLGPNKANKLSPWNHIEIEMIDIGFKEVLGFRIDGIQILDYYDLYRKFRMKAQEQYTLDYICEDELGERKVDYKEMGYRDLNDLYDKNHQLFIDYNIQDGSLVEKLDKKLKFIDLAVTMAYMTKVNFEDVFSQGRIWDANIYNKLATMKIAVPPKKHGSKNEKIIGAYVKQPVPGRKRWVVSFDLTSLYPHLIMMYNMSPETLVEPEEWDDELRAFMNEWKQAVSVSNMLTKSVPLDILKRKKMTITPNGQLFRTDKKGMLAELMEEMFAERSKYKKRELAAKKAYNETADPDEKKKQQYLATRYAAIQMALKITLNSAYGSIANQHFRFFDVRLAEGVTLSGQLGIRWIQNAMNAYFNKLLKTTKEDYILASDTDSIYLHMETMMEKLMDTSDPKKVIKVMDKLCEEKIMPYIDSSYKELAEYVNAFAQKMVMKREALADQGIWVGKKNYILSVYDNEGVWYETPDVKIVGWGSARSDKPRVCRDKLKEVIKLVLYKELPDVLEFVEKFRGEFDALPIQKVACPTGLNDMEKWADSNSVFIKGAPIHVKAALMHNHIIHTWDLERKYKPLSSRNKIRYVLLKEPNPFQSTVIGFQDVIPQEFELEKYLDKAEQFHKTFLGPLELVLESINWHLDAGDSLEAFFV